MTLLSIFHLLFLTVLNYFTGKDLSGGDATNMWYSEIKDYNFNRPGTFNSKTGHFTQVGKLFSMLTFSTCRSYRLLYVLLKPSDGKGCDFTFALKVPEALKWFSLRHMSRLRVGFLKSWKCTVRMYNFEKKKGFDARKGGIFRK